MESALIQHALVYGMLMSVILTLIVIASLLVNPATGLKDYPPQVKKKARKHLHPDTQKHRYWFGIPFLIVVIVMLILAIIQIPQVGGRPLAFLDAFLTVLIMLMVFNLIDLLFIDGLLGIVLRPRFMILPGTKDMAAYRDLGYYLIAFLRTSLMIVFISVAFASFAMAAATIL